MSLSPAARLTITVSAVTPLGEQANYGPAVPLSDSPDENKLWLTVPLDVFFAGRIALLIEDRLYEYVSFLPESGSVLENIGDAGFGLEDPSVSITLLDAMGNPAGVCFLYISSQEAPIADPPVEQPTEAPVLPLEVTVRYPNEAGESITPDTQVAVQPISVKINYVDADGNPLLESTYFNFDVGEHPVFPLPLDGYAVMEPSMQTVFVDENAANPSEVTFLYHRLQEPKSTEKPIIISSPKPSPLAYAIRKLNWGDTKEHVKEVEGDWILEGTVDNLNATYVVYKVKVASLECLLAYYFCDEGLYQARYVLIEDHSNASLYIDDYNTFKKALTQKYGKPLIDTEKWDEDSNKKYYSDRRGRALEFGHLSFLTSYFLDDTIILMEMSADNYEIKTTIDYSSISISPGTADYSDDI